MANKHEEMFNILRDVQMKITMRFCLIQFEWQALGNREKEMLVMMLATRNPQALLVEIKASVITMEVRMLVSPKAKYRSTYDTAIACKRKQVNILHRGLHINAC